MNGLCNIRSMVTIPAVFWPLLCHTDCWQGKWVWDTYSESLCQSGLTESWTKWVQHTKQLHHHTHTKDNHVQQKHNNVGNDSEVNENKINTQGRSWWKCPHERDLPSLQYVWDARNPPNPQSWTLQSIPPLRSLLDCLPPSKQPISISVSTSKMHSNRSVMASLRFSIYRQDFTEVKLQ